MESRSSRKRNTSLVCNVRKRCGFTITTKRCCRPSTHHAAIFEQGHTVGDWAKKLFPRGIDLGRLTGFEKPVRATHTALRKGRAIFEASFTYNSCFSRADIIVPTEDGRWDIIEVKSSGAPDDIGDLREVYLQDLAFQRYVYEGAGLLVRNSYLLLLNKKYLRSGVIDPQQLLARVDVTDRVNALLPRVPAKVEEMRGGLALSQCPEVKVSRHCSTPYDCALTDACWSFLPQSSVFNLRDGRSKPWDLLARGILRIEDVPADFSLNAQQSSQVACHRTGLPYMDQHAKQ